MRSRLSELYCSKDNRDKRYQELKAQGKDVWRSTVSGQLIHPAYLEDYAFNADGTIDPVKLAIQKDNGLGNTHYKTYFGRLYRVEQMG